MSKHIICSDPDGRKTVAVHMSVEVSVSKEEPASILQELGRVSVYLNKGSARLSQV